MEVIREIFSELPPPFNMIVLIVAFGCLTELIRTVAKQIRIFADHEADRRFKRDLVDSGLTVEESERLAETQVFKRDEAPPAVAS